MERVSCSIHVENLRELLHVEASQYPLMAEFKRRVLDAPIREINKRTQYRLRYEPTKMGRKITGFTFTMDCSDVATDTASGMTTVLKRIASK